VLVNIKVSNIMGFGVQRSGGARLTEVA
jgi:hypothetical protein